MTPQLDLQTYANVYIAIFRYGAPILAGLILLLCAWPLLTGRREPEIWAWLVLPNTERVAITHWENVIGRSNRCDIVVKFPTVSHNHAVLTRYDDGSWTVSDADSKNGTFVNGEPVDICPLYEGDEISVCGELCSQVFLNGAYLSADLEAGLVCACKVGELVSLCLGSDECLAAFIVGDGEVHGFGTLGIGGETGNAHINIAKANFHQNAVKVHGDELDFETKLSSDVLSEFNVETCEVCIAGFVNCVELIGSVVGRSCNGENTGGDGVEFGIAGGLIAAGAKCENHDDRKSESDELFHCGNLLCFLLCAHYTHIK